MSEVPKTPIQVEVGKVFNPFAGIEKFESSLEGGYELDDLISVPLVFEGIAGKLALQSGKRLLENDLVDFILPLKHIPSIITPLGEVGYNVRFKNGEVRIVDIPLVLNTEFMLSSKEEYNTLSSHRVEVEGGAVYLSLVEENNFERETKWYTKQGMQAKVQGVSRYENGEPVDALFPSNWERLAKLRLRFVEKQLDTSQL